MLNTININLKTDIKTDRPTTLPIKLMSQDKNNNQFILRFTNGGESVALDDTYTVEILTKFSKSGASRLTSAKVRQDYATWEFDTAYITQDEVVYNYVYVRKSGSLVVSADANCFVFSVDLSEIDKGAGKVAEVYDENYEKYLDEFKDNVNFEEIAQAEQARKEAETLREENYEQKVDTAIVEADVVAKVDNKVTELTPQISNITAQLAQAVDEVNKAVSETTVDSEVILARGGETTLGQRLDKTEQELNAQLNAITTTDKNLVNPAKCTSGYIDTASGAVIAHATYWNTDYIPVVKGDKIYINTAIHTTLFCGYSAAKTAIAKDTAFTQKTDEAGKTYYEAVSDTIAYARFTIWDQAQVATAMVSKTYLAAYAPFKYLVPGSTLQDGSITSAKVKDGEISLSKVSFAQASPNLFDLTQYVSGYYARSTNGTGFSFAATPTYGYIIIPVSVGDTLKFSHEARFLVWAGANKLPIAVESQYVTSAVAPLNAAYAYVTIIATQKDAWMIVKNRELPTKYIYGGKIISESAFLSEDPVINAFLPEEICVAVGRTIEIYNNQVCPTADKYHFRWVCNIGKAMERKFSIEGKAGIIGNHVLTLELYDDEMKKVWYGSTTLKIVAAHTGNAKIVALGDSLTNNKSWLAEIVNLNNNINFVGTRNYSVADADGEVRTGKHEGRSGWTAARYNLAGDAVPNDSTYKYANPFFNPASGHFDWNYYVTNSLAGVSPDAVQIFLGTNGISLDPTASANATKVLVDYIRADNPTIPIYMVNTLYRANQDGLGVQQDSDGYTSSLIGYWKLDSDMKVYNLMVRLKQILGNYSNLYFVPVALCHDSEYNYGAVSTPVNPRASQTEIIPTEGTHPQIQGYFQMADIMFSVISAHPPV